MGVVVNDNGMSLSEWHELHKDNAGGGTVVDDTKVKALEEENEELRKAINDLVGEVDEG